MKQFLLRALLPFLFFIFAFFTAFLPHPRASAPFSYAFSPTSLHTAQASTLSTPTSLHTAQASTLSTPTSLHTVQVSNLSTPTAGDYACILTDDVFFYSTADGRRGLFLLPKSYYVRLLEYRTDYCKIEYQTDITAKKLIGYAKTEALTFVDYVPTRPYLYYVFDVSYKIDSDQPTDSTFLTEITISCVYYGDYLIGSERYCYVLRGEEFGYVPKPLSLSYEENSEYADYLAVQQPQPAPPDEQNGTEEEKSSPAQIAILVAICLLVPILAALVLKPPRRAPYEIDD